MIESKKYLKLFKSTEAKRLYRFKEPLENIGPMLPPIRTEISRWVEPWDNPLRLFLA